MVAWDWFGASRWAAEGSVYDDVRVWLPRRFDGLGTES